MAYPCPSSGGPGSCDEYVEARSPCLHVTALMLAWRTGLLAMNSETDAEKDRLLENVSSSLAQLGLPRPQLRSSAIAHACTHTSIHAHMHAHTLTDTLSPTWRPHIEWFTLLSFHTLRMQLRHGCAPCNMRRPRQGLYSLATAAVGSQFMAWGRTAAAAISAQGYWAEIIDPCSGMPVRLNDRSCRCGY